MPVSHVCLCGIYLCSCRLQPAVAPKAEDQEALSTVRGIWSILQPGLNEQLDGNQRQRVWNELMSLLPDILPGLGLTGEQLFAPNTFCFGPFCFSCISNRFVNCNGKSKYCKTNSTVFQPVNMYSDEPLQANFSLLHFSSTSALVYV